jgi:outer membrane lipoprotein carrier protein
MPMQPGFSFVRPQFRVYRQVNPMRLSSMRLSPMRSRAAVFILVLFLVGAAHAGGRDSLAAFSKDLKGLEGNFTQQVFDSKGKRKENTSGRVAMSAPRLFRWEYLKPFKQLIIADGKQVWAYDPDLKQASVRPQGLEEQNSPLAALIDPQRLDRDFNVKDTGVSGGFDWLELTPKQAQDASFQRARLGFDKQGLTRMEVVDALGQRTEISFAAWKRNPKFPASTFRFKPPKGTDVVGARE